MKLRHISIVVALLLALTTSQVTLAQGFLRQSTASQTVEIGPYLAPADGTALNALTIANTDVKISKAGGNQASKNSGSCVITNHANGMYVCTFDATDTNTVGLFQVSSCVSTAVCVRNNFQVVEEAVFDRDYAAAGTGIVGTAQTGDNFARLGAPAGASVSADVAAVKTDTAATRTNAATLLEASVTLGVEFTADSGTTTTIVDAALTQATNDWFAGQGVLFTSGTLAGQTACITAFTAASDTLTITTMTATVGTQDYYILPMGKCQTGDSFARVGAPAGASVSADVAAIKAVLPAALVSGRIDSSVGAMAANVITDAASAADYETRLTTQANLALTNNFLDFLFNANYDPASKPGNAGGLLNEIVESDGGATRFTSEVLELAPTSGGGNMTQIEGVDATDAIDARIAAADILRPTTTGRKLDVNAAGNAGIDLDNITVTNGAMLAGFDYSGTLTGTHSTTTADLGTNAPGASVDVTGRTLTVSGKFSRIVTSYDSSTGVATFATVTTAGVNGDAWVLWNTPPGSGATDVNVVTVEGSDATTYYDTLDNPILAILGTPTDLGVGGANIADNLAEIKGETDDIGTAGAGLTSLGGLSSGAQGNVRTAVGLGSANLDTQLTAIDDLVDTEVATIVSQTSAATIRGDVGLAAANLDTQLSGINTKTTNLPSDPADASDISTLFAAVPAAVATSVLAKFNGLTGTCDSGSTTTCVDDALTQAAASQLQDRIVCFDDAWCGLLTTFTPASDTIATTKVAPSTRSGKVYTILGATAQ